MRERGISSGSGKDRISSFYDALGKLRPDLAHADPLARSILDAAAGHLSERAIVFMEDNDHPAQVPIAIYEFNILLSSLVEGEEEKEEVEEGKDVEEDDVSTPVLLQMENSQAFIGAGDVLLLPREARIGGGDLERGAGDEEGWTRVLSVDLLFARVRVCASPPPPRCWHPHRPKVSLSYYPPPPPHFF